MAGLFLVAALVVLAGVSFVQWQDQHCYSGEVGLWRRWLLCR